MIVPVKDHFLYFAYGSNLLKRRIHINNPSAEFLGIGRLDVSVAYSFSLRVLFWVPQCCKFVVINLFPIHRCLDNIQHKVDYYYKIPELVGY